MKNKKSLLMILLVVPWQFSLGQLTNTQFGIQICGNHSYLYNRFDSYAKSIGEITGSGLTYRYQKLPGALDLNGIAGDLFIQRNLWRRLSLRLNFGLDYSEINYGFYDPGDSDVEIVSSNINVSLIFLKFGPAIVFEPMLANGDRLSLEIGTKVYYSSNYHRRIDLIQDGVTYEIDGEEGMILRHYSFTDSDTNAYFTNRPIMDDYRHHTLNVNASFGYVRVLNEKTSLTLGFSANYGLTTIGGHESRLQVNEFFSPKDYNDPNIHYFTWGIYVGVIFEIGKHIPGAKRPNRRGLF